MLRLFLLVLFGMLPTLTAHAQFFLGGGAVSALFYVPQHNLLSLKMVCISFYFYCF